MTSPTRPGNDDNAPGSPYAPTPRRDPIECPHCGETTMPNELSDGSIVCSCTAERALPTEDGADGLPAPMDDPSSP